jgi:uncharacterized protein YabE (DUF348 family)
VAVLGLVVGGVSGFAALHKGVTIDFNGTRSHVTTLAGTVGDLLDQQDIAVGDHDLVVPALTAGVPRNGEVMVRQARQVEIDIDGQTQRVWTTAETVEEALADLGVRADDVELSVSRSASVARLEGPVEVSTPKAVTVVVDGEVLTAETGAQTVGQALAELGLDIDPADVVSQPLTESLTDGTEVSVARAESQDGTKKKTTKFKTVKKENPDLLKGQEKVIQKGRVGEKVVTYTATVIDGEEVSKEVLTEVVVATPVTEIVEVGTKEPPVVRRSTSSSVPNVNIKAEPGSAKAIAREMVSADDQYACLVALWDRESGWRVNAANRYSGAYGIPQALPGSKMASAGSDWRTNPATQIKWGLGYIKGRYGSPCGAWGAFKSKGWY